MNKLIIIGDSGHVVIIPIIISVSLITIPAFAQEMGFYENKAYDFSFNVPTDWAYEENVTLPDGRILQVVQYPQGFDRLFNIDTPLISVYFENIPKSKVPNLNGEELLEYYLEQTRTEIPNARIVYSDVQSTSWGWIVSTDVLYAYNLEVGAQQYYQQDTSFVFKDRESYDVGYVALDEDYFDAYVPVYEDVLGTLVIKGIEVNAPSYTLADQIQEEVQETVSGGCLIATATFGTELAPQVQQLRELRDNTLLQTQSGSAFMSGFNEFYYSFSPTIADWERENPFFKEAVKLVITPLITSLIILNYVDVDSEAEVLVYGIGVILLNIGMYFVVPLLMISKKFFNKRT